MTDRLECDDCGTLNILMAKRCSLCGASLAAVEARRREGDPRIMVTVATLSTIITASLILFMGVLHTRMGAYVAIADIRVTLVLGVITFFFGTLSVGFWKGYLRAHRARK